MTSRERINNTIDRKKVDRVPYSFDITGYVINKLKTHYGIDGDFSAFIGDDLFFGVGHGLPGESLGEGVYKTEFGVVYDYRTGNNIGDCGVIVSHPLKSASLDGYAFPDGTSPARFANFDGESLKKQDRFVIAGITGLFDMCWYLRGLENFMMDMAGDPSFAGKLMDKALEFNLGILEQMPAAVDGIRVGEDWGLQKGLMFGAPMWRKYLKPRLKIMYEAAKKKNLRVFIHSCGDIAELFPDIIELGVEVANPVQPEAMDIVRLQREYGKDIAMYGGLGSQSTLVYGSPGDVVKEAEHRLGLFSGGGYILGPAGAIPTDAKLENVVALVDFVMGLDKETGEFT
jgi:uroporphyrinogen decarboxylase